MTALSVAYMDQDEIPSDIDQTRWGNLDGNGGSEGYFLQKCKVCLIYGDP